MFHQTLRRHISFHRLMLSVLVVFVGIKPAFVSAQETLLTLDQAIGIALQQGYQMKTLTLNLLSAEQNYLSAKYRFRTNVNMDFSLPSWSERLSPVQVPNALPIYNSVGSMQYLGQLSINQPLPTDGTLTLSSQAYQSKETNFIASTEEELKQKVFVSSLSLRLTQPLFTYNRLQTSLRRAELNYESSNLSLKRTQLDVVYQVNQAFFNLYRQTRTFEINQETLNQRQEAYDLARLKYEAGLIPEVEALQMEVDLADAQATFYQTESDLQRQKDSFKQTLGLELSDEVGVDTEIVYKHFDIDMEKAVQFGLENRYELRENEITLELRRISVIETDAQSEISANLTASYDFTGRSDQTLPVSTSTRDLFDSSIDDLERRPANRGITLTVSLPVWDWGVNKAQVASAEANLRRAELDMAEEQKTIENGVREVVRSVISAENRMVVLEKSQEVAQRNYDISLERFSNGEITSQDLALDSNRLSSARLSYLNAYITYNLAVANLKRQTLWDFEKNVSLVE
ncbi:TolC family protein [Candidatus Latescibacterota bacterium]